MPNLSINKTYKDGDILFAADLDNICNSVTAFLNGPNLDSVNVQTSLINALAFTGMISLYGGGSTPTGWLACDGSTPLTASYPALATLLGTTYGPTTGTTFTLPDFRRRVPMGTGGVQVSSSAPATTIGSTGGEETHVLTVAELATHNHDDSPGGHMHQLHWSSGGGAALISAKADAIGSTAFQTTNNTANATVPAPQTTGGGGAHNNIQPSLVCNFMIKT